MQAQYAAENLAPLATEHFLVRKATDIASIKKLAKENPVAVVQNILESLGRQGPAHNRSENGSLAIIFTEAEWKRWWESTRKRLKQAAGSRFLQKDGPDRNSSEGVSHADELLAAFNRPSSRSNKSQHSNRFINSYEQFKEPEKQLQPIVRGDREMRRRATETAS